MPRASWRGFLRLSLVSCPIYLSPATTRTKPIRLHQVWQPAPVDVAEDALSDRGNSRPNLAPVATPAAPPAAPRPSPVALADRDAKLHEASISAAPIVALSRPFEDPVPSELASEQIDLVTLMFNYHDLGHLGVDRAAMNRAVFRALKPGGLYVIADHAGRPGTGISESGTLHRLEEAFLRQEVEAAGFRLVEEGKFLRNPNDPRDKNTPDPPQPLHRRNTQRYGSGSDMHPRAAAYACSSGRSSGYSKQYSLLGYCSSCRNRQMADPFRVRHIGAGCPLPMRSGGMKRVRAVRTG